MFSKIGTGELIVILIIALFVIGPEKLPGVAKSIGKLVGSASKYLKDITDEVKEEVKTIEKDFKEIEDDLKQVDKEVKESLNVDEPKAIPPACEEGNASGEAEATTPALMLEAGEQAAGLAEELPEKDIIEEVKAGEEPLEA